MSGVVEKVKAKVDQVLHKDEHHSNTTHTGAHSSTGHTGPHSSAAANKADPRVDSDRDGSHNLGAANYGPGGHHTSATGTTGTYATGPHNSNIANKADPRVDSDRDGSRNVGLASHGPGAHHSGTTGATGTTGFGTSHSTSTTAGPHDSNLANKLDPRVDSDRDGSRNLGAAQYGPGAHQSGHHQSTGVTSGVAGSTGYGSHSTNHGPHDSNIANKVDPRVDSDRDGSRNAGAAAYGPGAHQNTSGFGNTGVGSHSTNYGPHDSNLANKADPRVDSDRDGSRNAGAASYGAGAHQHGGVTGGAGLTGTSHGGPNTAGPHKSDFANKLDPRVDSDLDGSKTIGSGGPVGGSHTTY